MSDLAQINLAEPEQMDWNNYDAGSKYAPPPPALDASGAPITYYGVVKAATEKANDFAVDESGNPVLNFALDPIVINQGPESGKEIKYTDASVVKFAKKDGTKTNASKLGNYLRACGATSKPQTNDEYRAAVKAVLPKTFGFTIDWTAKNKDTGETIKGYAAFPDDPVRPGQKNPILKTGDFYNVLDSTGKPTGQLAQVKSEVLFANARLRFFRDPSRGK